MFRIKTSKEIKSLILDNILNQFSKLEGSYNSTLAAAAAVAGEMIYRDADWLMKQLFPWSVTDDKYLEYWMTFFGLERKEQSRATGTVYFKGTPFAMVPKGLRVQNRSLFDYETITDMYFNSIGEGSATVQAIAPGSKSNAGEDDINKILTADTNVEKIIGNDPITGGAEIETYEDAIRRMKIKASRPAHSGNKNDYVNWTLSVKGIGRVVVIGAGEYGVNPGSVKVLAADYNNRPITSSQIQDIKDVLEYNRPVGVNVIVESMIEKQVQIALSKVVVEPGIYENEMAFAQEFWNILLVETGKYEFLSDNTLSIGKVSKLLLNMKGVLDYDGLTLNGNATSVQLAYNEAPAITGISIGEFKEA